MALNGQNIYNPKLVIPIPQPPLLGFVVARRRCRSSALSRSGATAVAKRRPLRVMRPPRRQISATEASRVCRGPKRRRKRFTWSMGPWRWRKYS